MINLEDLLRIFTARGEKVVVVPPQGDLAVILPLTEYDKLRNHAETAVVKVAPSLVGSLNNAKIHKEQMELIDPTVNSITNDDQYFPEPIEE